MKGKNLLLGLFVALVAFIADQLSKFYVFRFVVEHGSPFKVCDFLNIVSAFNKGVSFSMFDSDSLFNRVALIVFALS